MIFFLKKQKKKQNKNSFKFTNYFYLFRRFIRKLLIFDFRANLRPLFFPTTTKAINDALDFPDCIYNHRC